MRKSRGRKRRNGDVVAAIIVVPMTNMETPIGPRLPFACVLLLYQYLILRKAKRGGEFTLSFFLLCDIAPPASSTYSLRFVH